MFWIFSENTDDNTPVIAEQCLHSTKGFSACAVFPVRRLGEHKELGGDIGRTDDSNWSEEFPITCDVILSDNSWSKRERVWSDSSCLPTELLHAVSPSYLEVAEHLAADWKWQINPLFCFPCTCSFFFTIFIPLFI